ncbi:MAG: fibronectin type III domain-containing protein [Gemmatimonadota bacterium]
MKRNKLMLALTGLAVFAAGCGDDDNGNGMDPVVLSAPAGVAATATSETSIQVTYNAVSGATGYIVERAPGSSGSFASVGTPSGTSFDDTGLQASTSYRYRVAATAGSDQSDFSDVVAITTPAEGPREAAISSDITSDRTLYADTLYTLQGFVKVANGATLTIEPGTVIEGDFNTVGSSLFVLRGARIEANGTEDAPIVFTSSQPVGERQAGDWGGLIIVGNGIINRGQPVILEGTGTGASNPQVDYSGGNDNTDDSGTLRYVRVEYAGFATAPDAELNTMTFAAVGSGTTLEYLQSLSGLDDGFEFFGGAVDGKYLVSYESGDDHFDMSEGYVGRLQHVISFQSRQIIPRPAAGNVSNDPQGFENDGCAGANCTDGQNSLPLNIPMVANFTLVGPPDGVFAGTSGGIGMQLRRGTGGYYVNGVVTRFESAAISLRDQSTLDRVADGDLLLRNILVADNTVTFLPQTGSTVQGSVDLAANDIEEGTEAASDLFTLLPLAPTLETQLDWSPATGSPIATGGLATFTGDLATKAGSFVTGTAYRGAADPNGPKWWELWTNLALN